MRNWILALALLLAPAVCAAQTTASGSYSYACGGDSCSGDPIVDVNITSSFSGLSTGSYSATMSTSCVGDWAYNAKVVVGGVQVLSQGEYSAVRLCSASDPVTQNTTISYTAGTSVHLQSYVQAIGGSGSGAVSWSVTLTLESSPPPAAEEPVIFVTT